MVNPVSWESFQKNEPRMSSEYSQMHSQKSQDQKQNEDFSWGNFQSPSTYQGEPDPTAEESTLGYFGRLLFSNVARAGERYLGKYGDVEQGVKTLLSKAPASMGLMGKALQSMMGQEGWDRFVGVQNQIAPTSEDVKKMTLAATGDYTKPKTKGERIGQEFSADVGSMVGARGATRARTMILNLGIPAAGQAAKETVAELGFGEDAGNRSKLAAQVALALLEGVNAPAYAAQLMNEGRNGFGPGVVANVPHYENEINQVARRMYQGDPRSALAQQQIAGIRNDMQNGQTSMRDLMNRYDALNAAKRDRGLFELGRTDRRAAIRNINEVRDAVRRQIEHIGSVNPEALQSWQNGVQAFSVIHQSNAITNNINRWLSGPIGKGAVSTLFGATAYGAIKAPAVAGTLGAGAALGYKATQVAMRVWQDPNLANYYWQAMRAAAQNNGPMFLANYNNLNRVYEKKYGQESH
jgi:hypothetical protein